MARRCRWVFVLGVVCVAAQLGCASKQVMGNKSSKVYHACECKCIERMQAENKVPFASEDAACKEGYRPCKMCFGKGDEDPGLRKEAEPKKSDGKKGK